MHLVKRGGEKAEILGDCVERVAVKVNKVDLVHRQHHRAHPQQFGSPQVATRLLHNAGARVHQQHHDLGGRHPCHRVACVLHVPRCIRKNERAFRRGKIAIRHINSDALLALRAQPVHQQRQIQLVQTLFPGGALHSGKLIRQHTLGVMQQPADKGGFPVIHGTRRA